MKKSLSDFRLATDIEINQLLSPQIDQGNYSKGGAIFVNSPEGIHSSNIFMVMHNFFGKPNYLGWEKSNWNWVIYTPVGLLSVYDYKGSWSIGYMGISIKPSKELMIQATLLKDALVKETRKLHFTKKEIQSSKIGGAILNPYYIYTEGYSYLMAQARKNIEEIDSIKNKIVFKTMDIYFNELIKKHKEIRSLYITSFICIFFSLEAFINLTYSIFLKDRFRNAIFENDFKRMNILDKLLYIDIYCHSFEAPPFNNDDKLLKAISEFQNIRNYFIHSAIYKPLETHLIKYGQYQIMVSEKNKNKNKSGLTMNLKDLSNIHIIRTERLVKKVIIKIIRVLHKEIRYRFAMVYSNEWIEYIFKEKDKVELLMGGQDIISDEEIKAINHFLSMSTDLDEDYYKVIEKEFKPLFL
jgi:hypothetical protein